VNAQSVARDLAERLAGAAAGILDEAPIAVRRVAPNALAHDREERDELRARPVDRLGDDAALGVGEALEAARARLT
jgi:hypothetical protein